MGRAPAILLAAACALVAVYLGLAARDEARVRTASQAGLAGDYATAVRETRSVRSQPAAARAWRVRAAALYGLGRVAQADRAFARAAAQAPADWALRRDWALVRLTAGDREGAAAQLRRARALNPRLALPPGFVAP